MILYGNVKNRVLNVLYFSTFFLENAEICAVCIKIVSSYIFRGSWISVLVLQLGILIKFLCGFLQILWTNIRIVL
jgi:hypothetical protein